MYEDTGDDHPKVYWQPRKQEPYPLLTAWREATSIGGAVVLTMRGIVAKRVVLSVFDASIEPGCWSQDVPSLCFLPSSMIVHPDGDVSFIDNPFIDRVWALLEAGPHRSAPKLRSLASSEACDVTKARVCYVKFP